MKRRRNIDKRKKRVVDGRRKGMLRKREEKGH